MTAPTLYENTIHPNLASHIAQIREACLRFGVKQLYAFGSITNSRFNAQSDVDFLVSFKKTAQLHLFDNYMNLHYRLAEIMHRKIDLITEDALQNDPNPYFNKTVENEKILLFDEN
jgi:uncharacterized protein